MCCACLIHFVFILLCRVSGTICSFVPFLILMYRMSVVENNKSFPERTPWTASPPWVFGISLRSRSTLISRSVRPRLFSFFCFECLRTTMQIGILGIHHPLKRRTFGCPPLLPSARFTLREEMSPHLRIINVQVHSIHKTNSIDREHKFAIIMLTAKFPS